MRCMFCLAESFNQDLSGWCVEKITSKPENFAYACPLQPEYYPVWGTCPSFVHIIENEYTDLFNVYPNPTNTLLTIETGSTGLYEICITSLNGQVLLDEEMEGPTHQIDLSSFQKGVYFITIRSRDYVWTEKIIKL
jgi:hypothetical protein